MGDARKAKQGPKDNVSFLVEQLKQRDMVFSAKDTSYPAIDKVREDFIKQSAVKSEINSISEKFSEILIEKISAKNFALADEKLHPEAGDQVADLPYAPVIREICADLSEDLNTAIGQKSLTEEMLKQQMDQALKNAQERLQSELPDFFQQPPPPQVDDEKKAEAPQVAVKDEINKIIKEQIAANKISSANDLVGEIKKTGVMQRDGSQLVSVMIRMAAQNARSDHMIYNRTRSIIKGFGKLGITGEKAGFVYADMEKTLVRRLAQKKQQMKSLEQTAQFDPEAARQVKQLKKEIKDLGMRRLVSSTLNKGGESLDRLLARNDSLLEDMQELYRTKNTANVLQLREFYFGISGAIKKNIYEDKREKHSYRTEDNLISSWVKSWLPGDSLARFDEIFSQEMQEIEKRCTDPLTGEVDQVKLDTLVQDPEKMISLGMDNSITRLYGLRKKVIEAQKKVGQVIIFQPDHPTQELQREKARAEKDVELAAADELDMLLEAKDDDDLEAAIRTNKKHIERMKGLGGAYFSSSSFPDLSIHRSDKGEYSVTGTTRYMPGADVAEGFLAMFQFIELTEESLGNKLSADNSIILSIQPPQSKRGEYKITTSDVINLREALQVGSMLQDRPGCPPMISADTIKRLNQARAKSKNTYFSKGLAKEIDRLMEDYRYAFGDLGAPRDDKELIDQEEYSDAEPLLDVDDVPPSPEAEHKDVADDADFSMGFGGQEIELQELKQPEPEDSDYLVYTPGDDAKEEMQLLTSRITGSGDNCAFAAIADFLVEQVKNDQLDFSDDFVSKFNTIYGLSEENENFALDQDSLKILLAEDPFDDPYLQQMMLTEVVKQCLIGHGLDYQEGKQQGLGVFVKAAEVFNFNYQLYIKEDGAAKKAIGFQDEKLQDPENEDNDFEAIPVPIDLPEAAGDNVEAKENHMSEYFVFRDADLPTLHICHNGKYDETAHYNRLTGYPEYTKAKYEAFFARQNDIEKTYQESLADQKNDASVQQPFIVTDEQGKQQINSVVLHAKLIDRANILHQAPGSP